MDGTGSFTVSGLEDACHRFTLRGTDLAGNTVAISRIVRVDTTAPAGGTLVVNDIEADSAGLAVLETGVSPEFLGLAADEPAPLTAGALRR